jgi:hypothetical protein
MTLKRSLTRWLATLGLLLTLAACASGPSRQGPDHLLGGSPYYSFGVAQSKENFANVRRAQSALGMYADDRLWADSGPGIAPARVSMVQYYFPFSMRWELKDGRQFLLENIDVRSIMQEYFKDPRNERLLQWQREGRPRDPNGDFYPSVVYEVKDDVLRLKWLLTINRTPVDQRILTSGAATPWDLAREEYLVTEIKGRWVQGIDFNQQWEVRKGINREK